jgi:S-adenosylmethionine:tRNA ribosyltransferase-isomerase
VASVVKNNPQLHKLESYDYNLPQDRIAQYPVSPRDHSRLLFVSRAKQSFRDFHFYDLPDLLQPADLIVINNTRVLPARLQSDKGEVLLVRETEDNCWDALVFPGKHFKPGTVVTFEKGRRAEVLSQSQIGRILRFDSDVRELLEHQGKMPLPPYISRATEDEDKRAYQTIYARKSGSIAAPTAGFHFTRSVFARLRQRGIHVARITLHVGPGTFRPVKSQDITAHKLYPEYYECKPADWNAIQNASRVIAVGTTTTRAVECIAATGQLQGYTGLFIYPGYEFKTIGGLITNFHLPKSSLLMLVSAFAGYDLIRQAYRHAIDYDYRFYSYGDAMLIL